MQMPRDVQTQFWTSLQVMPSYWYQRVAAEICGFTGNPCFSYVKIIEDLRRKSLFVEPLGWYSWLLGQKPFTAWYTAIEEVFLFYPLDWNSPLFGIPKWWHFASKFNHGAIFKKLKRREEIADLEIELLTCSCRKTHLGSIQFEDFLPLELASLTTWPGLLHKSHGIFIERWGGEQYSLFLHSLQ